MSRVTFLRDAQSMFNAGLSKERNPGLSEVGKQQAIQIHGEFDCIIVTNLRRSMQTYAQSFLKCRKLLVEDVFRESMNGVESNYLELEQNIVESAPEFETRARAGFYRLKELFREYKFQTILVITHHNFIQKISDISGRNNVQLGNCQHIYFDI